MIRISDIESLTSAKVLSRVSQEQIMVYYLGMPLDLNKVFSSPFRTDANPSCAFYYGKRGRLYIHDFSKGEFYDFADVVMKKLRCSYDKALRDIILNEEKIKYFSPVITEKAEIIYTYTTCKFQDSYFARHAISKQTMQRFDVRLVGEVYRNGELWRRSTKEDPIYAYEINDRVKLYRPLAPTKKDKFRSTALFSDVFGLKQLPRSGKLVIITSSVKDMMTLYEHGFNAISFASESMPQRGENAEVLKAVIDSVKQRFKYVITLFDSDETGIRNAAFMQTRYGLPSMFVVKTKDIADCQLKYRPKITSRLIKRRISKTLKT